MTDSVAALDRVFLRLASTSAEKLPGILDKLLPVLLGQLHKPSGPVFAKTLEIIKHVNTRVREDASVQLPCAALVTLIAKPTTPSFVRGLALMYLDMGLSRLSSAERVALLPELVLFVSLVTEAQIPQVATAILGSLPHYNKLEVDADVTVRKRAFSQLLANEKAMTKLLEIFLDAILLRGGETVANPPPGLSSKRITQFLTAGKSAISSFDDTSNNHVHILTFLRTGIFPQELVIPHFICGSLVNRHDAVDVAENALKRLHEVNYNNPRLVDTLFALLLGSEAQFRSATLPRTQVKILSHLARSDAAMARSQECLKIVFTLLFQEQPSTSNNTPATIAALKIATLDFANSFAVRASLSTQTGRLLLTAFLTVLKPMQDRYQVAQRKSESAAGANGSAMDELLHSNGNGNDDDDNEDSETETEQRDRAYSGIGHLARKQGELFNSDTAVPRVLLQCLSSEVGQNKSGVQVCVDVF
jgi:proteasome component ECM29